MAAEFSHAAAFRGTAVSHPTARSPPDASRVTTYCVSLAGTMNPDGGDEAALFSGDTDATSLAPSCQTSRNGPSQQPYTMDGTDATGDVHPFRLPSRTYGNDGTTAAGGIGTTTTTLTKSHLSAATMSSSSSSAPTPTPIPSTAEDFLHCLQHHAPCCVIKLQTAEEAAAQPSDAPDDAVPGLVANPVAHDPWSQIGTVWSVGPVVLRQVDATLWMNELSDHGIALGLGYQYQVSPVRGYHVYRRRPLSPASQRTFHAAAEQRHYRSVWSALVSRFQRLLCGAVSNSGPYSGGDEEEAETPVAPATTNMATAGTTTNRAAVGGGGGVPPLSSTTPLSAAVLRRRRQREQVHTKCDSHWSIEDKDDASRVVSR